VVAGSVTGLSYEVVEIPLLGNLAAGEYEIVCRLLYPGREAVTVSIPVTVYPNDGGGGGSIWVFVVIAFVLLACVFAIGLIIKRKRSSNGFGC
jgi:hypothetical protein